MLRHYNINPVFVFDGKPPPEKHDLLKQRRLEKKDAENKYAILKNSLDTEKPDDKMKVEMEK